MHPPHLAQLCKDLALEFRRDPRGGRVASLLSAYASAHDDWRAWAMFESDRYTRNLVQKEEQFELLLLCWGAAHRSPIHNHEGQRCWMAVLEGQISETLFEAPRDDHALGEPLVQGTSRNFRPSQVAFITDEVALHEISAAGGAPAVSLHLYSRPFSTCQVYDRETGRIAVRQLGYHSVRGERAVSSANPRS